MRGCLGFLLGVAALVGFIWWAGSQPEPPPKPCSSYADTNMKYVPLRCLPGYRP